MDECESGDYLFVYDCDEAEPGDPNSNDVICASVRNSSGIQIGNGNTLCMNGRSPRVRFDDSDNDESSSIVVLSRSGSSYSGLSCARPCCSSDPATRVAGSSTPSLDEFDEFVSGFDDLRFGGVPLHTETEKPMMPSTKTARKIKCSLETTVKKTTMSSEGARRPLALEIVHRQQRGPTRARMAEFFVRRTAPEGNDPREDLGSFFPIPGLCEDESYSKHSYGGTCLCHDEPSRLRMCFAVRRNLDLADVGGTLRRLKNDSKRLNEENVGQFFETIMSVAPALVGKDVRCDEALGAMYINTNLGHGSNYAAMYTGSGICLEIRQMMKRFPRDLIRIIRVSEEWYGCMAPRGIFSAVMYLDEVGNSIGGQRESIVGIHVRLSAAFTSFMTNRMRGNCYVKMLGVDSEPDLFGQLLSITLRTDIVFSRTLMARVGLKTTSPICSGVIVECDNANPEDALEINARSMCKYICDGVPFSVNVTRTSSDPLSFLKLLEAELEMVRSTQRIKSTACIYFDVWSVHTIKILDYILGLKPYSCPGVHFCAIVPDVFIERMGIHGERWTLFSTIRAYNVAGAFGDTGFKEAYEATENAKIGMTVGMTWMADKMETVLMTGRLGVVFLEKPSKVIFHHNDMDNFGVDLVSQNFGAEYNCPTYCGAVNLAEMLDEVVPDCVKHDVNMHVTKNTSYLNLKRIREAVRILVACLDAAMEMDSPYHGPHVVHNQRKYRSIGIGVVGFHTMLMKMALSYDDDEVLEINRVIAENIYYAAVRASVDLCIAGHPPCEEFKRTIYSSGCFTFDRCDNVNLTLPEHMWKDLREDMVRYGMRHACLVSLGPFERESAMVGVSSSFSPGENLRFDDTVYTRPVMAETGMQNPEPADPAIADLLDSRRCFKLPVANRFLSGVCGNDLKTLLEGLKEPENKTLRPFMSAYQLSQERTLELCHGRDPFVDQTQAPFLFFGADAPRGEVLRHLRKAHELGLKVGVYKCKVRSKYSH